MKGENPSISNEPLPQSKGTNFFSSDPENFLIDPDDSGLKYQAVQVFEIEQGSYNSSYNTNLSISRDLCGAVLSGAGHMKAITLCTLILTGIIAAMGAWKLYFVLPLAKAGFFAGYRLNRVCTFLFIIYLCCATGLKLQFLYESSALFSLLTVCILALNSILIYISVVFLLNLCRVPKEDTIKLVKSRRFFEKNEYQLA